MSPSSEVEISIAILSLLFGGLQWYHARLESIKHEIANSATLSLELSLIEVFDEEKSRQMKNVIVNAARALPKFSLSDKETEIMVFSISNLLELQNFVEIMTIHTAVWTSVTKAVPAMVNAKLSPLVKDAGNRILVNAYQEKIKADSIDSIYPVKCQFISDSLYSHLNGMLHSQIVQHIIEYPIDPLPPPPPPPPIKYYVFADNESAYKAWVEANPKGFILTTARFDKTLVDGVMLHTSRCWTVTNFDKRSPGAFVEQGYIKVCANELEPLREWLREHGNVSGEFDGACKLCHPLGANYAAPPKKITPVKPAKEPIVIPPLDKANIEKIKQACLQLPPAQGNYLNNDYIENLLLTVVDFMLNTKVVVKAQQHYIAHEKANLRTYNDIERFLETEPNTEEGNTKLAQKVWGYNLHTRIALLRGLVEYFGVIGVTDQAKLSEWANTSHFTDFAGKVPGLGFAVYQYLVMRQGIETIKPDVHVTRFVRNILGHSIPDQETVSILEKVAQEMGSKAYELDWRIWEHQRAQAG